MHRFAGERPDNTAQSGSVKPASADSTPHCRLLGSLGVGALSLIIKGPVRESVELELSQAVRDARHIQMRRAY